MALVYNNNVYCPYPAPIPKHGPFRDINGDYWAYGYWFGQTWLIAARSQNQGATWDQNTNTNTLVDATAPFAVVATNTVHHLCAKRASQTDWSIFSFTASSTKALTDIYTSGTRPVPQTDVSSDVQIFLVKRQDGSFVIVYQGPLHNTSFRSVYYQTVSAAGVFGTPVEVDPGTAAKHFDLKSICLGTSDRVHILYANTTDGIMCHRSLSSANVLDTAQNLPGSGLTLTGWYGISYGNSGLVHITPYAAASNSPPYRAGSQADPTFAAIAGVGTGFGSGLNTPFIENTQGDLYCFWKQSDGTPQYSRMASGGSTWDAPVVLSRPGGWTTNAKSNALSVTSPSELQDPYFGLWYQVGGTGGSYFDTARSDNPTFINASDTNGATTESASWVLSGPPKNYRVASGADGNFAALVDGVDQTAASRTDGWTVAKIAATNMSEFDVGTKQTSGTFSTGAKPASFLTGATANAFKTPLPLWGTFSAQSWVFTFAVRATTASSQRGRMRMRVFKSANSDGSSATELTGATQIGTTSTALSTSADVTSVVTWTPGTPITLTGEYLFFVLAWEITTASGSNSGDVVIRTGQAAAGSFLATPNFTEAITFPTTSVVDNFNRTNAAPPGGSWTNIQGTGGFAVVSNQLKQMHGSQFDEMWWASMGADAEIYLTFAALSTTVGHAAELHVRHDPTGQESGYMGVITVASGPVYNMIGYRRSGGASTAIIPSFVLSLAAGDAIGVQIQGSQFYIWQRKSGAWSLLKHVTDTVVTAPGRTAIHAFGSTWAWDDWGAPAAPTVVSSSDANGATTESGSAAATAPGPGSDAKGATTESASTTAVISATDAKGATTETASLGTITSAADVNGSVTETANVSTQTLVNGADANGATSENASAGFISSSTDANGVVTEVTVLAAQPTSADSGTDSEIASTGALVSSTDANGVFPTDSFDRANGSLGPNWADQTEGGAIISSNGVKGIFNSAESGNIWTGFFNADQTSDLQVMTLPTGPDWVGVCARVKNGGADMYLAIYWFNSGSPVMRLYKRISNTYTQLGGDYTGAFNAGDRLKIRALGTQVQLRVNNVAQITVTDTDLVDGAPGIRFYGQTGIADNWIGGGMVTVQETASAATVSQISASDSNGAVTEAAVLSAPVAATDSGTDAEIASAPRAFLAGTDAATDTETVTTNSPVLAPADTGTISETISAKAVLSSADTGTAAEAPAISFGATDSNLATTEAVNMVKVAGDANGTTTEIGSTAAFASVSSSDTNLTISEIAAAPRAVLVTTDTATVSEAASTGTQSSLSSSDTGLGASESASLAAKPSGVDQTTLVTENASTGVSVAQSDTGVSTEQTFAPLVKLTTADFVISLETASLGVQRLTTDLAVGTEISWTLGLSVYDTLTSHEDATTAVSFLVADMGSTFETASYVVVGSISPDAKHMLVAVNGVDPASLSGIQISRTSLIAAGTRSGLSSVTNGNSAGRISDVNSPDTGHLTKVE